MSVCTCATLHKSVDSAPASPRKSTTHDDEDLDIGREFGFSQRTLGRDSV